MSESQPGDIPPVADAPSNDVIADYGRRLRTQARIVAEESGLRASVVQRAATDGVNAKALREACKLLKQEPDAVARHFRDVMHYHGVMSAAAITPEQIYDGWDTHLGNKAQIDHQLWTAQEAGYAAGRSAVPLSQCPYTVGTEFHAQWFIWHKRGVARAKLLLGEQGEVAPVTTARVKRASNGNGAAPEPPASNGKTPRFAQEPSAKRGRGRPKGAKNKPRQAALM